MQDTALRICGTARGRYASLCTASELPLVLLGTKQNKTYQALSVFGGPRDACNLQPSSFPSALFTPKKHMCIERIMALAYIIAET